MTCELLLNNVDDFIGRLILCIEHFGKLILFQSNIIISFPKCSTEIQSYIIYSLIIDNAGLGCYTTLYIIHILIQYILIYNVILLWYYNIMIEHIFIVDLFLFS